MKYRADIDGLRSVAVVPVVLFHAGFGLMPGGFVGVDVFFVISGFLITSIIYQEMVEGKFSFISFYDRRVRRIFPALYFMLFICSLFALFILIPYDLIGFGRSMIYTAFFASNFYFWSTAGYFAESAETLPLLHTWSLAVEEQFYLFFPPVLLLFMRLFGARWLFLVLLAGALVSLAASAWGVFAVPRLTFYLLPTRAWELLIGSLIAVPFLPKASARLGSALAAAGLVMIAVAIATFDGTIPFPGLNALLPCVGAGLVIYGGAWSTGGIAKRALEWAPVVYVGRVSYSLYLWHWPILVFGRLYLGRPPSALEAAVLVAVSFALAAFSLRYVEAPFRGARSLGGSARLRLGAGAGLIAVASVLALTFTLNHGLPGRVPPETLHAEAVRGDRNALRQKCLVDSPFSPTARQNLPPIEGCLVGPGAGQGRYDVVVWGDSQADTLVPAVVDMVAAKGWTVREITMQGCPPLLGADLVVVKQDQRGDRCAEFNALAIEAIRSSPDLKLVVMAGRWSTWSEGGSVRADPRYMVDAVDKAMTLDNSRRVFARSLDASVRQITGAGVPVLLVGQAPEFETSPWRCTAYARLRGDSADACKVGERNVVAAPMQYSDAVIRRIGQTDPQVSVVLPTEILCDGGHCFSGGKGTFYYLDANHLTSSGARHVLSALIADRGTGAAPPRN